MSRAMVVPLAVTGAVAAVVVAAIVRTRRSSGGSPERPGRVGSERSGRSEVHNSPLTPPLHQGAPLAATEDTEDEDEALRQGPKKPLSEPDTRSIFDTLDPPTGESLEPVLERQSYPVDVDDLGATWLSRATQATSTQSEHAANAGHLDDLYPTLDLDELSDADPPSSEEPTSEWLRAAEARERRRRGPVED